MTKKIHRLKTKIPNHLFLDWNTQEETKRLNLLFWCLAPTSFKTLKMVQRKVANKGIYTHNTKPSLQNHDTKIKGPDLKMIKMKKSRLIKRSDSEVGSSFSSKTPGKPPPLLTPSPCKSSYTFPNYMRSTTSSEARNEKKIEVHKTSSLKKVRTLTKAPSFKHTRTSTCSSTLKDSKFPPYLELQPGATEAQGNSLLRVCPYNYCSLNGHHHNSPPPLKRFISSRRRQLRSQKVDMPQLLSPRKTGGVADTVKDFFIIRDKEVATQVSESLSDGPCSEIDQNEETTLSEMNFISEGGCKPLIVSFGSELEVESSPSVISDEFFCENLDIEWEEGQIYATSDNVEILNECHCSGDQGKPSFKMENSFGGHLDEFNQYPPYFQDEIVEFLCFSDDGDSLADSESTQTDEEVIERPAMDEKDEMHSAPSTEVAEKKSTPAAEAIIHAIKLQDESDVIIEEVTKAQNEGLKSYKKPLELDGDEPEEDIYMTGENKEENTADRAMEEEEREPIKETINDMSQISLKGGTCKATNDDQNNSSEVKLYSQEDNVVKEKTSEMGEVNSTEVQAGPKTKNKLQEPGKSFSNQELLESCNISKRVMRCRKEDKDVEEEKEFNPRGPNFLDIEPNPGAEKVDLRHQEMDGRKNAEEWMLDYALQKTVNQLAPARKKKVALLVEAFEAVLPIPNKHSNLILAS